MEMPGDQISTIAAAHISHEKSDIIFRRVMARLRRDVPLALLDAVVILACYACVLVLRFDGSIPEHYWKSFRLFMPLAVAIHLIANHASGLYGQMWRYASVQEARRIVVAGVVGGVGVVVANLVAEQFMEPLPRAVIFLGPTLALMGAGAIRFQSRLRTVRRTTDLDRTRVLLVGAGDAGAQVLRDIVKHPALRLSPVGFVDDDRRKRGRAIHGVPVIGGTMNIPALAHKLGVDQILLTIPSADSELVRTVAELADIADVTLRVLPSVNEIMGGKVSARDIRDLKIEDLLGRQQVETDLGSVSSILSGRKVLITGAGGSIGSETGIASSTCSRPTSRRSSSTQLHTNTCTCSSPIPERPYSRTSSALQTSRTHPRQPRERHPNVHQADRARWPGHRDRPLDGSLLHERFRGGPARPSSICDGT